MFPAPIFTPNCTLPPDHTSYVYVSGPNVRSTLSILWNCLSIIILCTWNILHLNIPVKRSTVTASSTLQKLWWAVLDSRKKAKWMILSILMPELLVAKAWDEFLAVRDSYIDELAHFAMNDETEWGRTHSYYANLGGFVLDFTKILDQQLSETSSDNASALIRLADEVAHEVEDENQKITLRRMRHKLWALISSQILQARKSGLIQILPQVSGSTLETFNKGDILVKSLALIQVSWLIIQLIARKIARLPSSQLEIAVLAFSASSIVTYSLYWSRPQGVMTVWIMKSPRLPTKQEMKSLMDAGPEYSFNEWKQNENCDLMPIPNHVRFGTFRVFRGAVVGGTVFGGLHCLAWNFHFPTPVEALGWKICSILTTVLPLVWLLSLPFVSLLSLLSDYVFIRANNIRWIRNLGFGVKASRVSSDDLFYLNYLILITYIIARLFLMVEIFRTLFFLPPEAFIETWSGTFPHWG